MKGLLVRVGIDQAYGSWNAPVDPRTGEFAYVPIPEHEQRPGMKTTYTDVEGAVRRFPGVALPTPLRGESTHLDPDFAHLTYGDNGERRGATLATLDPGDVVAFFAGMAPVGPWRDPLLYGLIGVYRIRDVRRLSTVPQAEWSHNAHTRRANHRGTDVIVRGRPGASGRVTRAIPIGEWRDRAYRVRRDLLEEWGGLSCRDGYIQRSAVPPRFEAPERFMKWLDGQEPELIATNNP